MNNNYWNKRYWQRKIWKLGTLLLIWQDTIGDSGLWQLFLPGRGPKDLPEEHRFKPLEGSDELRWKETAVDELLNRDSIIKLPAAKKDVFCGWQRFTTFETDVLARLAQVPAGKVISYGVLAGWAGYPRAARAVGRLMAKNPFPLLYPCHRVIRTGGRLGNFGGGTALKRQLLQEEGVAFSSPEKIYPKSRLKETLKLPFL